MYNPTMQPSEAAVTRAVLKYINGLPRAKAEKRHGSVYTGAGKQDILACVAGRHVEIELKRPGEEPRPLQDRVRQQWERAGAITGVAHSVDEVKALFRAHGLIR